MRTTHESLAGICMFLALMCLMGAVWLPEYIWQFIVTMIVLQLVALFLKAWAVAKREGRIK